MKMWTMDNTLQLIDDLRAEACLWQVNSVNYKKRARKYEAFTKLAEKHGMTASEMEKKIQSLKSQFRREHRKMLEADRNGTPRKQCQWFGYKPLMFLKSGFEARPAIQSCDSMEVKKEDSVDFADQEHEDLEESVIDDCVIDEDDVDHNRDLQSPVTESRPNERRPKRKTRTDDDECGNGSYQCMKTLIDVVTKRDQYSVYGEHIAHKLRTCKRASLEIDIAQHHLDSILFNLSMGAYSEEASKVASSVTVTNDFNHI